MNFKYPSHDDDDDISESSNINCHINIINVKQVECTSPYPDIPVWFAFFKLNAVLRAVLLISQILNQLVEIQFGKNTSADSIFLFSCLRKLTDFPFEF